MPSFAFLLALLAPVNFKNGIQKMPHPLLERQQGSRGPAAVPLHAREKQEYQPSGTTMEAGSGPHLHSHPGEEPIPEGARYALRVEQQSDFLTIQ